MTSALPDRLAGEIRHAVDLVAGFLDSLPGLDDPHSYLSAAEEGIEQATSVADLSAATKLTDAYHAASMGALSCALENRTETGLHAEALFIMSAVEKDARARSDANGASTAWEKAARDLGRATRESLRRERHTAEEPFIALTAHRIVWAAAIGGPDHGILLRSDHQNSPTWLGRRPARGVRRRQVP